MEEGAVAGIQAGFSLLSLSLEMQPFLSPQQQAL